MMLGFHTRDNLLMRAPNAPHELQAAYSKDMQQHSVDLFISVYSPLD